MLKEIYNEEIENYIVELYEKLYNIKKEEIKLKEIFKENEEEISKELAELLNYRKKDNNPDTKRIKKAVLKETILQVINNELSKIEEKYNILEEYKTKILKEEEITEKNLDNVIHIDLIKKYLNSLEMLNEIKEQEKEIKGEYQDKTDKKIVKIIDKMVKNKIKKELENNKNKEDKEIENQFEKYIKEILEKREINENQ